MKKLILKNNFISILKTLLFSIFTFCILMGVFFYLSSDFELMSYFIVIFIIFDFPAWYLFITYFFKTSGSEIHIRENRLIIIDKYKNKVIYEMSDIEYIEFFKSKSEIALHPAMNYSYIKISLKNKKCIYITCLMTNNLDTIIERLNTKYSIRYGLSFLK